VPILTERKSWAKSRSPTDPRRSSDLTPAEQANVRAAIRFLRVTVGGFAKLATAMGARCKTVENASGRRGKPSAGIALRVARVAGVAVEDVLAGRWPPSMACPHCGRAG
jgi:hypothetical protein